MCSETCVWRLARQLELLDKNDDIKFLWVTEFPLLRVESEEENRFTAMHHPFTMPMEEDLPVSGQLIRAAVRAKAYDIVL